MDAEKREIENNNGDAPPPSATLPTSPRSQGPSVHYRTRRRGRRNRDHDVEANGDRSSILTSSSSSSDDSSISLDSMGDAFKRILPTKEGLTRFYSRFTRKGRRQIGFWESLKNIAFSSWLNLFVVFIPLAWVSHYATSWKHHDPITFALCFLALVPLEWLFDWGGEQLAHYCGKNLGDLVIITLNNAIEATLAIVLLKKCKLRLMQSTIVGVVVLHLLLIPGMAFVTGGARIMHQELHAHSTELNHSLLTVGVLSLLLPAAFFAALDNGATVPLPPDKLISSYINDTTRDTFLKMSRGMAVILLIIYICSRIFLHNPPGDGNALSLDPTAPLALRHEEKELEEKDPKANQYLLIVILAIAIGIMAATTEWLVESIEFVAEDPHLKEEWFGMILLPVVSFAANGFVAIVYFLRYTFRHFFKAPEPPAELAKARAIDLSIQFTLFWMPFFVLLAWWIDRPLSLLFDFFEIAVLLGACFLVNYVTADSKTNWAEGIIMVSFYVMIALCAWFYDGQPDIKVLAGPGTCPDGRVLSVAETISNWDKYLEGHHAESGGVTEHAAEGAAELIKRMVGW